MGSKFEKYIQEQLLEFVNEHEREVIGIYDKKSPTGYSYLRGVIRCEAEIVHEVGKIRQDFDYPSLVQYKIAKMEPKLRKKFIEIFIIQRIIQEIRKEIKAGLRLDTYIDAYRINNSRFSTLGYPSLNDHQTKMLALVVYDELQYDYIKYSKDDDYPLGWYYLSNEDKLSKKEW